MTLVRTRVTVVRGQGGPPDRSAGLLLLAARVVDSSRRCSLCRLFLVRTWLANLPMREPVAVGTQALTTLEASPMPLSGAAEPATVRASASCRFVRC